MRAKRVYISIGKIKDIVMGIEKAGLQLGKEIIAWTRTSGKSLLATRPVKVNTAGLRLAPPLEGDVVQINKTIQKRAGTILNTRTGLQEPITFSDLPTEMKKTEMYELTAYNQNNDSIGRVSFKKLLRRKEAPVLYIEYFGTAGGYKGIGSEMIRKLVHLSKTLGMEGRIKLEACTGSIPPRFQFKGCSDKCKTSAVIQYKKMGFNADKWTERTLQEEMASGGNGIIRATTATGLEYNRDIFGAVEMDLSEGAIKKYLQDI